VARPTKRSVLACLTAAALEEKCELGILLAELSRDRLAKVCGQYALTSDDTSREGYIRTILAAAAGITVDEARTIEAAPARPAEEGAPEPKPAIRTNTEGYRAAIAALPRGVLHRIEADLDPGKPPQRGDIVRARHRQYVVTNVVPPADPGHRNPELEQFEDEVLDFLFERNELLAKQEARAAS
jgi:hypothetical protein